MVCMNLQTIIYNPVFKQRQITNALNRLQRQAQHVRSMRFWTKAFKVNFCVCTRQQLCKKRQQSWNLHIFITVNLCNCHFDPIQSQTYITLKCLFAILLLSWCIKVTLQMAESGCRPSLSLRSKHFKGNETERSLHTVTIILFVLCSPAASKTPLMYLLESSRVH